MKESIKYAGTVNDKGKLSVFQERTFKLDIATKFKDKKVWVTIEERTDKPSKSQWGYMFAVIIPRYKQALYREAGMTLTDKETQHFIEDTFLKDQRSSPDGKLYEVTRSMGDLRLPELSKLIDTLIVNAATELHEVIPFPNEKLEK